MITANNNAAFNAISRQSLRKLMLEKRRSVLIEQPLVLEKLSMHLLRWLGERDVSRLGFYRPIRSEPDLTGPLIKWKDSEPGRCLCVPVIDDCRTKTMHYALWSSDAVRIGSYGIEEPIEDYSVEPEEILVPCVGVTHEGYRLGNGGGYFDRWLAERNPVTVAVAYEALVTEDFAPEEFDIPLDWILTESGIRRAGTKTDRSPKVAVRLL